MPVHRGGGRQPVGHAHPQHLTLADPDRRTRHLIAVPPRRDRGARQVQLQRAGPQAHRNQPPAPSRRPPPAPPPAASPAPPAARPTLALCGCRRPPTPPRPPRPRSAVRNHADPTAIAIQPPATPFIDHRPGNPKTHVKYRVRVCAYHVMVKRCCRPLAKGSPSGIPGRGAPR
ncbi:tat pathway signal sequence domain protein [Mycobacteroides abscessus 21]|uniref:Tat pathway signal sequence domain protein n=1 Tax=Mycobacteroides abscessus 21 TaxID=1299324 RepID=A0A829QA86_9MYCO|nr:tat pathway signal sequence domain protein [Mycobacteroides abscessus 21]